jgi:hypothetical protein
MGVLDIVSLLILTILIVGALKTAISAQQASP